MTPIKAEIPKPIRFLVLLAGVMAVIISGCSKKSSTASGDNDSVITCDLDTIQQVVENADTLPISAAPVSNSPKDLIDFINESPDREKYEEGIIPNIIGESSKYAYKLLTNQYDRFIVVDKSRMKVILFDKYGRMEKTYGMACAKNYGTKHKKADSRTPEGFFSVEGIYDSTEWLFTDDDGVTSKKKGQFGPRFIRIKIPGTSQIGIHGTCAPWSIGSRASHGCIRIKNENILELVELVEPGMPVIIVPGRKDMEQNLLDGEEIAWIPTTKTSKKPSIKTLEELEELNNPKDSVPVTVPDSIFVEPTIPVEEPDSISVSIE